MRRSYGQLSEAKPTRMIVGDLSLDLANQQVYKGCGSVQLSLTEFRLLSFLVQNRGQVFDRESLLKNVWGFKQLAGDNRTVDVHVRNLRRKIESDPVHPRIIITVRGFGYMVPE